MSASAVPSITLVRIGDASPEVCASVAEGVSRRLGVPCRVADGVMTPDFAQDARRGQYCSTRLLERLQEEADGGWVLGVADVDLFMPVLTFVFGEAILGGRVAVVSLHRLRQTVYGLPDDPALTLLRAEREAVHELGHAFGLVHCPDYRCALHATRSVEEIDLAEGGLCEMCSERLELGQSDVNKDLLIRNSFYILLTAIHLRFVGSHIKSLFSLRHSCHIPE